MPPQLALLLCLGCIVWLFRTESRTRQTSAALWIPVLWLLIHSSRPVSSWFGFVSNTYITDFGAASNEGNPFERNIFFLLMVAALWVLSARTINWRTVIRENRWVFLLYLFFLLSTVWADHPFVAFKRWFKNVGHVLMALVVLTETDPLAALKSMCARCAYLLFPLSALFIKYYSELGRVYTASGEPTFAGVTNQKNQLGEIVVVFGLILLWDWLATGRHKFKDLLDREIAVRVLALLMGAWLLHMSHSATSLVCMVLGVGILLAGRLPVIRRNRKMLVNWSVGTLLLFLVLQQVFDIQGAVLELLGRDRTLTGRSEIWEAVRETRTNPVIGVGFSSYWSSEHAPVTMRGDRMNVVSAHNGYLDVYLDGGIVGVGVLLLMLLNSFVKIARRLQDSGDFAVVQFAFLLICVVRNFSESSFLRGSPLWFAFLLISMMSVRACTRSAESSAEAVPARDLDAGPRPACP